MLDFTQGIHALQVQDAWNTINCKLSIAFLKPFFSFRCVHSHLQLLRKFSKIVKKFREVALCKLNQCCFQYYVRAVFLVL